MYFMRHLLPQEQARRQSEEQQQQQQEGENQDAEQLVPDATELKLLRRMELEIQAQVKQMLRLYPELQSPDVDPLILDEVTRLALRHERVTELFQALRERIQIPAPQPVDG